MNSSIFVPLKERSFRRLFFAQVFSDFGNWLDFTALAVLVAYHWKMGPGAIAALTIAVGIPWVLVGPFASVWTDRLPRKKIMIICDFLRAVIAIGLIWTPNLPLLLVLVFLKSSVGALFDPAKQAAIRSIVPEVHLPQANSLSQLSSNSSKIIAPALGGLLIAVWGPRSPFILETVAFLISAFLLTRCFIPFVNQASNFKSDNSLKQFWFELMEGWKHILSNRILLISIGLVSLLLFFVFLYDGLLVLLSQSLGLSEATYGFLISAVGFGSVAGSLVFGQWNQWKENPIRLMVATTIISGVLILLFGLGGTGFLQIGVLMWIMIAFFIGVSGSAAMVPYGYILQIQTPESLMGRVSASANAFQNGSMLVAPALGAILAKWVGVGMVFLLAGIAILLAGIITSFFVPRVFNKTWN
ncbi:MFS transporter [Paenisporosarcina quisquiliarum]|uniref:MFS transporter n=1 Tax=Paenisporosarcina quisquiliarum TaxID=365346 RepID=UPI003735F71C